MKNPFYFLIVLIGIAGWANIFSSCTNTAPPVVVPPAETLEDWHCTPIAPIETTGAVAQKGKAWPNGSTIKIGFPFGGTDAQKMLVKSAYAAWKAAPCNLSFEYPAAPPYDIRVSFSPGSAWAFIGIDAKSIQANSPTLNFGFGHGQAEQAAGRSSTMEHEAGHSLGLLHEQQIPGGICWNEANVIAELSRPPNSWDVGTIRRNVLDYHNPANIITSVYDKESIMHYQIPARWTCNNTAIPGGDKISNADKAFISTLYPLPITPSTGKTLTVEQVARMNALLDECKKVLK